ncbi:peptide-n(4)-(n-acetyl-beta-glucosaminyl)asparagine amidase [Anaeramoeba flamelloides]|uniref:Peptide-n(4)-(N-acetyl-beta-glucosaminyl)asparagine amidase n=1 Tax=Anaeramoeba flamelloides TaxID=1746091 RepID=A0AAV7Y7M2_9EUKA|nr:peptide-n(4)-(n-acetyl-beta-glucosaminyl)asparagine amidase [Anaeramoeba flamelloides]
MEFSVKYKERKIPFVLKPETSVLELKKILFSYSNIPHQLQILVSNEQPLSNEMGICDIEFTKDKLLHLTIDSNVDEVLSKFPEGEVTNYQKKMMVDIDLGNNFENRISAIKMMRRIYGYLYRVGQYQEQRLHELIQKTIPIADLVNSEMFLESEKAQIYLDSTEQAKPLLRCDQFNKAGRWGFLLSLMHWFKTKFFKWFGKIECPKCNAPMERQGYTAAFEEDLKYGAPRVEQFCCTSCKHLLRFPRYNSVERLLQSRIGRCGEWANVFAGMTTAFGYDTRLVLDLTDHVWVEVFNESTQKWIHFDPCEDISDKPLTYEVGWGKKLTYIIAFGPLEVVDVTPRYTQALEQVYNRRFEEYQLEENWFSSLLHKINSKLQEKVDPQILELVGKRNKSEQNEFELKITKRDLKKEETRSRISGFEKK